MNQEPKLVTSTTEFRPSEGQIQAKELFRHGKLGKEWGFRGVRHSVVADSAIPMDCNLPGFSVHGILHTRILEWGAISFSRGSS